LHTKVCSLKLKGFVSIMSVLTALWRSQIRRVASLIVKWDNFTLPSLKLLDS